MLCRMQGSILAQVLASLAAGWMLASCWQNLPLLPASHWHWLHSQLPRPLHSSAPAHSCRQPAVLVGQEQSSPVHPSKQLRRNSIV